MLVVDKRRLTLSVKVKSGCGTFAACPNVFVSLVVLIAQHRHEHLIA